MNLNLVGWFLYLGTSQSPKYVNQVQRVFTGTLFLKLRASSSELFYNYIRVFGVAMIEITITTNNPHRKKQLMMKDTALLG